MDATPEAVQVMFGHVGFGRSLVLCCLVALSGLSPLAEHRDALRLVGRQYNW